MLIQYFKPKVYIHRIYDLDFRQLHNQGICLLLCDIDNTLVGFDEKLPTLEAQSWIKKCHKEGIDLILLSNNTEKRVKIFSESASVRYMSFSCKPFRFGYQRIIKQTKLKPKQIACVGDQILTDILGGNRMGLLTIFCDPLVKEDSVHTRYSRFVERYILKWLTKRNEWKKGEYYEYKV